MSTEVAPPVSPSDPATATAAAATAVNSEAIGVVRDALDASVQRLLAADPIARVGNDPEGVHQARVATRRLRSDLRTFEPLLDSVWVTTLRDELRWLGAELGQAREAEVLLGHLRNRARALPPDIERHVSAVLDAATGDRAAAYARVLEVLRSPRYLDLVDLLVQGAMAPRVRAAAGTATAADVTRLARRPWKQLRRDYRALGTSPSDPALHAVRIRAKRARYAVEAVAGAVDGDEPRKFAAALTGLQDVLGDHQDAVVAEAWLRARIATGTSLETYSTGMLAGLLRADALAAIDALPAAWRRANRRRLRSWMS
jgi:CHAD domain-containing protein